MYSNLKTLCKKSLLLRLLF